MTKEQLKNYLEDAISAVKGSDILPIDSSKSLVRDYGFESIDIIDLLFEIEKKTKVSIDLTEIAVKIGAVEGRRFNDLTIDELLVFLDEKTNK